MNGDDELDDSANYDSDGRMPQPESTDKREPAKAEKRKGLEGFFGWILLGGIWLLLSLHGMWLQTQQIENIPYSRFLSFLKEGKIKSVDVTKRKITGTFKQTQPGDFRKFSTVVVEPPLAELLNRYDVEFSGTIEDNLWSSIISWLVPMLVFFGIWILIFNRAEKQTQGGLMSIGRSKARVYIEDRPRVTFADVAGVDEAKEELKEVVSFLIDPDRYGRLGGRLPKGILLVGPSGTGKTLLARAVAGEAGVPFFSISGSEFVEMFVGVGAARVRDLFSQAQAKAPCIIFIDELDALGRARGLTPFAGGHDEKEQTLNQLLVEMDGFDPRQGVILLAATNRPEILDPALLRAGRFDRQVLVDRPDKKGREDILRLHMRHVIAEDSISFERIAGMTAGFSGADLANLVNEAALLATRRGADKVSMFDFYEAIERVIAGLERKNRLLNPKERKIVAYHETGHALVALSVPGSDPVQKVTIIPRGMGALGYTMQHPTEDRYLLSRRELLDKLTVLLGGRASEELVFDEISTGAADDLSKATEIARNMITRYGMNERLGLVAYESDPGYFLKSNGILQNNRRFSEETAREIDLAVKQLTQGALSRAKAILQRKRVVLDKAAETLLEKETLTREELEAIAGPPSFQGDRKTA